MEEAIKATANATVERVVTDSTLWVKQMRYYYSNGVCVVYEHRLGELTIDTLYPKPNTNE